MGELLIDRNIKNLEYISGAYLKGKLSHAYILEGAGKEEFADTFSRALMCASPVRSSEGVITACGQCPSCIKALTGNHPDIIHVRHEKTTVLSVDEIRQQVVADIAIKPYYGPYKIYIISDADLMNENAQNALLKTIEEPESYGLIFLLSENESGFLDTIRSRCITLRMEKESPEEIISHLMDDTGKRTVQIICDAGSMNALEINKAAKELESFEKDKVLHILRLWFRDVLVYKSTKECGRIYFSSCKEYIMKMAGEFTWEGLNRAIEAVRDAADRLDANVKAEAVYESMLLAIRENEMPAR